MRRGTRISNAGTSYTIPVAVHIVHGGGPENISDQQVLSQIYALNRDFGDSLLYGAPAVDTRISFCLAQNLPPASTVVWSSTPGITRTQNGTLTNHTYGNPTIEAQLKAIDYLPSDKYLNVWVVANIVTSSGSLAGYATFPNTVPQTLDGIVIRAVAFGSNFTPFGSGYNLLPSNQDGKILSHEVGHWLNLYHTFHGGCSTTGDQVSDTPPEQVNRSNCPSPAPTSCTAAADPIENFMDYTNDPCRYAFTAGQKTRMHVAIGSLRPTIASAANLIATGCSSGLDPLIVLTPAQLCAGGTVQATTTAQAAGMTYAWSFPGGTPSSATTQSVSNISYATAGVYPVTLTVTTASNVSATNSATVYALACAPIANRCTNWTFGANSGLSFATGAPVAVSGRIPAAIEAATTMSDPSGNLLFYSDGVRVIDRNNNVMPNGNGLDIGGSSSTGVTAVPRPGSSTQYYLFGARMMEDAPVPFPITYSVIDMSLNGGFGDIPPGQKNLPVTLPGNPTYTLEAVAAIPHCNGNDWFLITHGGDANAFKIYVTYFNATGPISTQVFPIGLNVLGTIGGQIRPTLDGTKFTVADPSSQTLAVYNFNRTTGAVTTLLGPQALDVNACAVLSPSQQILYYTYKVPGEYGVRQLDMSTLQTRYVARNLAGMLMPGPDGKIYMAQMGQTALHTINFPDQFNQQNQNECGWNPASVPVLATGIQGSLPNLAATCTGATLAAAFTTSVSNCLTVQFKTTNCTGPFNWTFGDAATGSGATVSHTYAGPGTYTVTLTATGSSPSVATQTITLGLAPVTIAGSNTACTSPLNYSVIGPASYTYSWFVSGGTPAFGAGNGVDVVWGSTGGSLTLTVTDPATGCTQQLTKNVGPCPVCKSPPLNMTAWWPLDEITGTTGIETVLGSHATDVGAPQHVGGMVRRARLFDGSTQHLDANDAPGLNFGTGDLTIDAWVRTSATTGIRRIVDKRTVDPARGYSLYLKNGRLALGLGAPPNASIVEYWSPTTPFVADGQWHHVAGVVERNDATSGTRLYVDGIQVATFAAFDPTGNVTNTEKLRIGAGANGASPPTERFPGTIDEVELFQRALTTADLSGIDLADSLGKCKEFVYVPRVTNVCRDGFTTKAILSVCNYTTTVQSYQLAFGPLAANPPTCSVNGPTTFVLAGPNPVTVAPNSCVAETVTITRPLNMPVYSTACYAVTATNTTTSQVLYGQGSISISRQWCNLVAVPATHGGLGAGGMGTAAMLRFTATNTSGGPLTMPYTIAVQPAPGSEGGDGGGGLGDPSTVMLNGLPPDTPLSGDLTLANEETANIDVVATFAEPRAFRFYDVVLHMDEDGDGTDDASVAHGLTFHQEGTMVDVPPPAFVEGVALELAPPWPNPTAARAMVRFTLPRAGNVTLALYDIAGRRVRTLFAGPAAAGPGAAQVDYTGLARGLYFLGLETEDGRVARRVTIVR